MLLKSVQVNVVLCQSICGRFFDPSLLTLHFIQLVQEQVVSVEQDWPLVFCTLRVSFLSIGKRVFCIGAMLFLLDRDRELGF